MALTTNDLHAISELLQQTKEDFSSQLQQIREDFSSQLQQTKTELKEDFSSQLRQSENMILDEIVRVHHIVEKHINDKAMHQIKYTVL